MDLRFKGRRDTLTSQKAFAGALTVLAVVVGFGVAGVKLRVEEVALTGCNSPDVCREIRSRLIRVLNSLDSIDSVRNDFTQDGVQSLKQLHAETEFHCVSVLYEVPLVNLPSGRFEVRGIRVRVQMGNTKGNPDQHLVISFNKQLLITDVRFSIEKHHIERILGKGERLSDFSNRQKILHFVEVFRTAYNRKDIDFLRKAYSDDALIIVGRVLEEAPQETDMMQHSLLTRDQIRFVELSKAQYLTNLERVFARNDFIKVDFDDIEVIRHDTIEDIYGVTLKQKWQSSTYSDDGYLFLMIDFIDEDEPLIHVRTWQPEEFPDGSVISLYDFNIVE